MSDMPNNEAVKQQGESSLWDGHPAEIQFKLYLAGAAFSPAVKKAIEEHLVACEGCRYWTDQMKAGLL